MKYFSIIALMMFLAFSESQGQSLYNTGSIYSYYGAGAVTDFRDPNASGMGMTGVGLSITGTNLSNPATWSSAVLAAGTGGFEINTITSSNRNTHVARSQINITHFQLILPVVKQKFGISASLYPITQSNYHYQNTGQIDSIQTNVGNVAYQNNYKGSGGLNALEVGFGWNITKNLSVGYAPSLVFGKLTNDVTTSFSSVYYYPTHYNINTTNIGMGNRVGLFFQKNKVFNSNDLISFGATASLPVTLKSDKSVENYINISGSEVNKITNLTSGNIRLPLRAGFGLGYWFNNHWMVGGEALYQKWGNYKGINSRQTDYYKDRLRFGMGGQFLPARSVNNPGFFRTLVYRAGFSYDTGYLKLQGQNISSLMMSAGIGIPSRTASSIDIDLSYGWRGTTSHDLVRERIFSIKVSFNLAELMFFKRKIQ